MQLHNDSWGSHKNISVKQFQKTHKVTSAAGKVEEYVIVLSSRSPLLSFYFHYSKPLKLSVVFLHIFCLSSCCCATHVDHFE